MILSVIICTFNRCNFLKLAVESLLNQSDVDFEILVVDNNSVDNTKETVNEYLRRSSIVRYSKESKIGLSHARNRGVVEARGSYIAFVDDDCIVPSDWIDRAKHIIMKYSPDIFGGPVLPFYHSKKTDWYKDEYATFDFGNLAGTLTKSQTVFGGNILIRRTVFEDIGLFRIDLGMAGNQILYSEETEFQLRYLNQIESASIYYDPRLFVHHFLRPEKMTLKWNIRAFIGKGRSNYLKSNEESRKRNRIKVVVDLFTTLFKLLLLSLFGLIFRSRKHYPYFCNFLMERLHGHFKKLGFLLAHY